MEKSKICGRQPLKADHIPSHLLQTVYLPQILLGPFLNTLSQMFLTTAETIKLKTSIIHVMRENCPNTDQKRTPCLDNFQAVRDIAKVNKPSKDLLQIMLFASAKLFLLFRSLPPISTGFTQICTVAVPELSDKKDERYCLLSCFFFNESFDKEFSANHKAF